MRYTVAVIKEVNVSPETQLAIASFRKVQRMEARLEKAEKELEMWVTQIPKREMEVYVEITSEIQK